MNDLKNEWHDFVKNNVSKVDDIEEITMLELLDTIDINIIENYISIKKYGEQNQN